MAAGAYIMNLMHYLNAEGEIVPDLNRSARELAYFLALVVDSVTTSFSQANPEVETKIRCRRKKCQGSIIGVLESVDEPIDWYCMECGHHGVIYDWQNSKWDNTVKKVESK